MKLRSRHLTLGFSLSFMIFFPFFLSAKFDLVFGNIQVLVAFFCSFENVADQESHQTELVAPHSRVLCLSMLTRKRCKSKCIDISKGFVKAFTSRPQLDFAFLECLSANPSRQDD